MTAGRFAFLMVTAVFTAAAAAVTTAQSQPSGGAFSVKIEAVRVDVLVTSSGEVVRGLMRQDFEVLDNGVPQQVDLVSFEQIPPECRARAGHERQRCR